MLTFSNKVLNNYLSGMDINDALTDAFEFEIQDKIKENEVFAGMTPFQMAMYDAGISKYSKMGDIMDSALYTSSGLDDNQWLFPIWVETTLREAMYERNIISYLVNTIVNIDGNTVQSPTLNLRSEKNKKGIKRARIAEGADIPIGKIQIGERAITLWKHGRGIEMTYEAVRRIRVDLFARHMNAIASDLAFQNLDFATDTLVNGDGNTGSASTELGETANANTITAEELASFFFDYFFENHFPADTIVAPVNIAKQISAMTFDSSLASGAGPNTKFIMPQFDAQNVTVLAADVPKIADSDVILLLNRNNTLVRYVENGSNIQENQNFIRNQTKLMTFTENSGYAINTAGSNMHIKVRA